MYKVLLVDDERIIIEGLQKIIMEFNLGFEQFILAEDGTEALKLLESYQPDVMITDVRMIYIDGLTLCDHIRQRTDALKDLPIIIISGYDSFSYAKAAIQYYVLGYLVKPIDKNELYDMMFKARNHIAKNQAKLATEDKITGYREELLFQLLSNRKQQATDAQLLQYVDQDKIQQANFAGYSILGVYTTNEQEAETDVLNYKQSMGIHVEMIKQHFTGDMALVCAAEMNGVLVALVGFKDCMPNDPSAMKNTFGPLIEISAGVRICSSQVYIHLQETNVYFEQVRMVYKNRKVFDRENVITYEEVKGRNKEGSINLKQINLIVQAISQGDTNAMIEQLADLKRYLLGGSEYTAMYIESVYHHLCMEVYKNFYSISFYAHDAALYEKLLGIGELIDRCGSYEALHSSVREILHHFAKAYKGFQTKKHIGSMVEMAMRLIDEQYDDPDISLQYVADQLNVSISYFSAQFKKEADVSFSDYITEVRMRKAMELLLQKELAIQEVSKKIGYASEKHFFVVFKKYTGMTPLKYRQKMSYGR